ncbi:hypothetical protein [Kitasatospora aureofaciens]|uniref:hypothetical protein n=1 Tax=Kitasatospora aureofaciens TaxID=1894 RepID=UPI001C443BAE|nr:hypothetical protein [Kitasatospora aureofaciens]MBV6696753.1 hypothetical protein [Kitasatospora aureofaciens]
MTLDPLHHRMAAGPRLLTRWLLKAVTAAALAVLLSARPPRPGRLWRRYWR